MYKYLYFIILLFILSCQTQETSVTEEWAQTWGTDKNETEEAVAVDAVGNIYVTGVTQGRMANSTNVGGANIFLSKFNPNGKLLWTKQWGSKETDIANDIAISNTGFIYISGRSNGQMDIDSNYGGYDLFLIKCDTAGNRIWLHQWGNSMDQSANALCIDQNEDILLGGYTVIVMEGKVNTNLLLIKFDSSGSVLWNKIWGTRKPEWVNSVAIGKQGAIFITGGTIGDIELSKHKHSSDAFLIKLDSLANPLWARQWGTNDIDEGKGLVLDAMGNVYVAGFVGDTLEENMHYIRHNSFLSKYNSDGEKQWIKQWGLMEEDLANDVQIDSLGDLYVLGMTDGKIEENRTNGGSDLYLTKFDANGQQQWTKQWGIAGYTIGNKITIDKYQFIYIAGNTSCDLQGNRNKGDIQNALLLKWHL